jgi:myo-inositol-1-phosphate synthase
MSKPKRLGIVVVGLNGAVSSTMIAGVKMMVKGLCERRGMVTEPSSGNPIAAAAEYAALEDIVFGGWDIRKANVYDAALRHGIFRADQLEGVKKDLENIVSWPAIFAQEYAKNINGDHLTKGSHREQIAAITKHIEAFQKENGLDRIVMINLASTEKWLDRVPAYDTLAAFEKAIDANDPAVSPTMRYFYAANALGVPHVNFAPSLANIPALIEHSDRCQNPYAGMDGKTGQTLVKTVLASMFRARQLHVEGWYSTNFLGNNDGLVLDSPESNKTKVMSKQSVLDSILGYKVENHQVHIHYYKPRGDAKEAWDNIDITGFGGVRMQMKVDFLCQDSTLAAPLVLDLARLLDVAKTRGEAGPQEQLSMFFKSPYTRDGNPVHDFFVQERMLLAWLRGEGEAAAAKSNGKHEKPVEKAAPKAQPAARPAR